MYFAFYLVSCIKFEHFKKNMVTRCKSMDAMSTKRV